MAYFALGNREEAQYQWEMIIAQSPNDALAHHDLTALKRAKGGSRGAMSNSKPKKNRAKKNAYTKKEKKYR
jgi:hypothetical protein